MSRCPIYHTPTSRMTFLFHHDFLHLSVFAEVPDSYQNKLHPSLELKALTNQRTIDRTQYLVRLKRAPMQPIGIERFKLAGSLNCSILSCRCGHSIQIFHRHLYVVLLAQHPLGVSASYAPRTVRATVITTVHLLNNGAGVSVCACLTANLTRRVLTSMRTNLSSVCCLCTRTCVQLHIDTMHIELQRFMARLIDHTPDICAEFF